MTPPFRGINASTKAGMVLTRCVAPKTFEGHRPEHRQPVRAIRYPAEVAATGPKPQEPLPGRRMPNGLQSPSSASALTSAGGWLVEKHELIGQRLELSAISNLTTRRVDGRR